jgi:hypothetical protein
LILTLLYSNIAHKLNYVELRGIPAHVWWRSMSQRLLSGGCWVQELHANTKAHRHMSMFHLSTWCRRPDLIPPVVDLFIPDPAAADQSQQLEKKGLIYPVRLQVVPGFHGQGSPPPSLSVEPEHGRCPQCHRRHHCSSPQHSSSDRESSARASVHIKMGPSDGHVEAAHLPWA